MDSKTLRHLEGQYSAHNYHPLPVVIDRAEGVWVWDVEGNKYLDCLSAYSAVNQGHRHPRIVKAALEQMQRVTLTSRAFRNDQFPLLCQELCQLTGYDKFLPMNTGAEAVETALKTARKHAYDERGLPSEQAEIIACSGNFHGRTIAIISCSTEELYRDGFGPFTPGFRIVPYGDAAALEQAITPNTAAVLVEPPQGEAGVVLPPEGYLKQVRELCTRHGILLLADEIQTGLGRTGKMWACEHEGVRPDMLIVGKALGGGFYPVSGVLASAELLGVFTPGTHGSTFGGNPLGAAVAREALKVLVEEGLVENSARMGEYFMEGLRQRLAQTPSPYVTEIRGKGLFVGVVLNQRAREFCAALAGRGVLCKETHDMVIRFAPPLIIDKETVDWALERITAVLTAPYDEIWREAEAFESA
ncbi:MAG TPA: ornithine--oxo-acid transaminase [Anaerolineae bacterium]|nr:ornithine--oxo-acid transaminase [Anaerolineae bacterium]